MGDILILYRTPTDAVKVRQQLGTVPRKDEVVTLDGVHYSVSAVWWAVRAASGIATVTVLLVPLATVDH